MSSLFRRKPGNKYSGDGGKARANSGSFQDFFKSPPEENKWLNVSEVDCRFQTELDTAKETTQKTVAEKNGKKAGRVHQNFVNSECQTGSTVEYSSSASSTALVDEKEKYTARSKQTYGRYQGRGTPANTADTDTK